MSEPAPVGALAIPVPGGDEVDLTHDLRALVASIQSPGSRAVYIRDIRQFIAELCDWFGLVPEEVTEDALLRWWRQKVTAPLPNGRQPARATVNRKVVVVRRFYREGARRQLLPAGVADYLPGLKVDQRPRGRALSQPEAEALIRACSTVGTLEDLRDRVAVCLLLMTGIRLSEAARFRFEDMHHHQGHRVFDLIRKGGRPDMQKVPGDLGLLLDAWSTRAGIAAGAVLRRIVDLVGGIQAGGPGPLSVRAIHATVKKRSRLAGLGDDVGPHDLRYTYITAADEVGCQLTKIQRAAGHQSPETTTGYVDARGFFSDNPSDAVAGWLRGAR